MKFRLEKYAIAPQITVVNNGASIKEMRHNLLLDILHVNIQLQIKRPYNLK